MLTLVCLSRSCTQVTILDDERSNVSRINHLNCSVVVSPGEYPAGTEARFDIVTRNYAGNVIAAASGEGIAIQIMNKVRLPLVF